MNLNLPPAFFTSFPTTTGPRPPTAQELRRQQDEAAWTQVARDTLAGKYLKADDSTRESLTIGLRSIQNVDCQNALKLLNAT